MTAKALKRARTEEGAEAAAEDAATAEVVTVRFVGTAEAARIFQYTRSGIVARAPGSIFAHRFGPGGLNEGKEVLPAEYTLDRSAELFEKHVDPYLRGYAGPTWKEWKD
ncbi:hypothetical protein DFJ74DRAFT_709272 [Hyaloraphidium curvatum]|nr:hypothetical protein DFJ74DRAFT_709272 [Hyaloraphidium curvatum]